MDFKSLIKNLFTLGGEDRKFIKEVDEFIEESEKKISEIEAKDEILRELMKWEKGLRHYDGVFLFSRGKNNFYYEEKYLF